MKISISVFRQGKHILVAACDANLLGKTLKYGKINFEIRHDFYGGSLVNIEDAMNLIKSATIINLVGQNIVDIAVQEKLIHPKAILYVSGIPHAQSIKI